MRIGYDAKRLFNNFTGLGNYSRTTLQNLYSYYPKEAYYLYTPKITPSPETTPFLESEVYRTHVARAIFNPYWRSYGIRKQLKADRIDLYHGLSHEIPLWLSPTGIRSVVTIHDLVFKRYPGFYSAIDRKIYDLKFGHSCRKADRVIAISESTKRDIIQYYGINPKKIDVVYQSCAPLYYEESKTSGPKEVGVALESRYLLFVGSISARKNIELILEAYRRLPATDRLPLVVVGRGRGYKARLMKSASYREIGQLVSWVEDLDDNRKLQELYRRATALIYPSFYEGFGLPIVEALLSRTPVIAANTSSLPEAGGPDSLYVDPNRPEDLAEAIRIVQSDTERREKMRQRGYTYAIENFSPQITAQRMMETYRRTMANQAGS